jgi:sporulation protein YlmC with PRC-barrel domain
MPATLPIEIYDLMEKTVGKENARELGKVVQSSLDAIETHADSVIVQKKAELKEELSKELVNKEDLAKFEGVHKADIARLEGMIKSEVARLEGLIKSEVARLDGKIDKLESYMKGEFSLLRAEMKGDNKAMRLEHKIYFLVLLFVMLLSNPKALDLIAKIFGIAK